MGQLQVECFAQGSDNTLYALAFGFDLGVTTNDNTIAALIKSNASPSGPSALTWTVVSTVRKTELFSFYSVYKTKCLVDPNGAFVAWSYGAYRTGPGASAPTRPGGFRYDPTLSTPSTTTTGKGGWVNIETALNYPWTSTSTGSSLFYMKDSSGKYNIYHTFVPGSVGIALKIAALNTASTPNMMEMSTTSWSVSSTITGYIEKLDTSLNKLFIWGVAGGSGDLFAVGDLPQSGALPSSAPSLQLGNYSTPGFCYQASVSGDKAYKFCQVRQTHGTEYKLYTWDGSKTLDPIAMSQFPIKDLYTDSVSGIFGDSTNSYLLLQTGALATDRGATGYTGYTLKALALSGGSAGTLLDVPNNITVEDNIGFYSNANSVTGSGVASGLKIVGIIFGVLFVCAVVLGVRKKKEQSRRVYVPALIPVDVYR